MFINKKVKLDARTLVDLCKKGISGGDQKGMFVITSLGGEELEETISITHEAYHLSQAIERTEMALNIILNKTKK